MLDKWKHKFNKVLDELKNLFNKEIQKLVKSNTYIEYINKKDKNIVDIINKNK